MDEQELRQDIAFQISRLPEDQIQAVGEYIRELTQTQEEQTGISQKYLTFWCDDQLFGICIAQIMQIIQVPPITPLPNASLHIKGVICMRDDIIPILDLRLCLGKAERDYDSHTCIIIVTVHDRSFGLVVDSVNDVETIQDSELYDPPVQNGCSTGYLTGIAKKEHTILLLDTAFLVHLENTETLWDMSKEALGSKQKDKENIE